MSILRTATFVTLLLVVVAAHAYAPTAVFVLLCVFSLFGAKQAIQALSLGLVIKFLNPAVYQYAGPFALLAWLQIALAGGRIFVDSLKLPAGRHPVIPWLMLFSAMVVVESMFASRYAIVSIFKVVSFTFAAAALLVGFRVTAHRGVQWTPWFVAIWLSVAGLSAAMLLFPGIGFARNGTGFQGILNQPQALGVFVAPMVAWLTATLLFSPTRPAPWLYLATPGAWALLFLSAARTAFVAVVVGFLIILIVAMLGRPEWLRTIRNGALRPISFAFGFVMLAFLLLQPSIVLDALSGFVRKGNAEATIEESFADSRGRGIEGQWRTFNANPLFGIGFGVSLDRSFKPILDPLLGLPLSAPSEKGFLPTALLEETGLVGAAFFLPMLISLFVHVFARTSIVLPWVFLASVLVNAGEMIFFSAGGLGLYVWLLIGWSTSPRWERRTVPMRVVDRGLAAPPLR